LIIIFAWLFVCLIGNPISFSDYTNDRYGENHIGIIIIAANLAIFFPIGVALIIGFRKKLKKFIIANWKKASKITKSKKKPKKRRKKKQYKILIYIKKLFGYLKLNKWFVLFYFLAILGTISLVNGVKRYDKKHSNCVNGVKNKIKAPTPYYVLDYLIPPPEGSKFDKKTMGDLITIYGTIGEKAFHPVCWLQTPGGYPGVAGICYQGPFELYNEYKFNTTNYTLYSLNAYDYDKKIIATKYRRVVTFWNSEKGLSERTNIVSAKTDPFLMKVLIHSYRDMYRVNLSHGTRIKGDELEPVINRLVKKKLRY